MTIQKLEYELTIAAKNSHVMNMAATDKDMAQANFIKQLQGKYRLFSYR